MHATHDNRRIAARLAAFVFSGLMLIAGAVQAADELEKRLGQFE